MEYKQLKYSDLKKVREQLLKEQSGICPVSKINIPKNEAVVDHCHRLNKDQPIGENGAGLIRGVLHRCVNSWEGKVFNAFRRYGLHKLGLSLPDLLRNLADYLENKPYPLIHPTEKSKESLLKKSSYNILVKVINNKQKIPKYNKKYTKALQKLYEKYELKPEFYK